MLMNLDYWPSYVTVRQFINMEKPKADVSTPNMTLQPKKIQRTVDGDANDDLMARGIQVIQ